MQTSRPISVSNKYGKVHKIRHFACEREILWLEKCLKRLVSKHIQISLLSKVSYFMDPVTDVLFLKLSKIVKRNSCEKKFGENV